MTQIGPDLWIKAAGTTDLMFAGCMFSVGLPSEEL